MKEDEYKETRRKETGGEKFFTADRDVAVYLFTWGTATVMFVAKVCRRLATRFSNDCQLECFGMLGDRTAFPTYHSTSHAHVEDGVTTVLARPGVLDD